MRVAMVSIFSASGIWSGYRKRKSVGPVRAACLRHGPDGPGQILGARAAVREVRGDDGLRRTGRQGDLAYGSDLGAASVGKALMAATTGTP